MNTYPEKDKTEGAFPSDLFVARGMSLRDYYIGQALTGLAAGILTEAGSLGIQSLAKIHGKTEGEIVGQLACEFADETIKVRNLP